MARGHSRRGHNKTERGHTKRVQWGKRAEGTAGAWQGQKGHGGSMAR